MCVLSPAVLCVLLSVARGGVSRTEVSTYRVHFACDLVSLSECRVEVWWRERSGVKGGKGVERIECLRRGDASERRDPACEREQSRVCLIPFYFTSSLATPHHRHITSHFHTHSPLHSTTGITLSSGSGGMTIRLPA